LSERVYSVEEANALLPDLHRTLGAMQEARRVVIGSAERVRRAVKGNGGGTESGEYSDALALLKRETERLSGMGVVVRDIERGLVDFPAQREGKDMFLCWQLGEPSVQFWHPVDTGFSGRRPL
jgi:hypothetical protein